ncbi:MAG: pyruvate/2-oxoglutarate dehydrogenase complex, dihydrolipoamide acyltransferase (E2) component [halophilic archaeon J07HX5]|jgi:Pyruvate/2-oxoglutarate dehydrogenase complex, dihydrolipoamide acyltransferase (E2) component, and related enzymes|nr:MAG: pyruvate/2-oxoglutarate dehydrogenase complex, dihydrolipoamide acyltransferase (E2) component [halophilic archaeon J07HX5]
MFEYELPDVGEGVAEGEIVAWTVELGDSVEEDDVLAEIETDKAVVDLPAPVDGTIETLHAEVGDVVPVGEVVVTIDDGADETAEEPATTADDTEPTAGAARNGQSVATNGSEPADEPKTGRVFAPPRVRRLARELGVDLGAVTGSGPSGRVTEGDVRAAANGAAKTTDETSKTDERGRVEPSETAPTEPDTTGSGDTPAAMGTDATPADRERTLAAPATRKVARDLGADIDAVPTEKRRDGTAFVTADDVRAYTERQRSVQTTSQQQTQTAGEQPATDGPQAAVQETAATTTAEPAAAVSADDAVERREPYAGIRQTIGEQMERSVYTAPHVTHHDKTVVTDLVEMRDLLKTRAAEQDVSLTYLPFVLKSVVAGLKRHPVLNTSLDEETEEIVYKSEYNIGVAVATDHGLLVPVVKNVDQKGLLELATEVNDLAARARSRDLAPDEMRGGTFSVTNFGAIGGEYATPIINYPETAVLGLGEIKQRPVAEDGEVCARATLPLSLSVDHRVIDGADAATFTNTVMENLADPTLLLL